MTPTRLLVVAKAPHPGQVKTRLGAEVGHLVAADVAASALLDTLLACREAFGPDRCHLALAGDLSGAALEADLRDELAGWTVRPQRGDGLATRLTHAHLDLGPGPVVQIGMDTPQVHERLLDQVAGQLDGRGAVLGPAVDGGWWALALRDPADARALGGVAMSRATTGRDTRAALEAAGLDVAEAAELRDVDTAADAEAVAATIPESAFARAWRAVPVR
ncbi:MAG: TIGR04282 family arsenosugar biosynthesis glycosyltransferase [Nocardioides sp.]